jgi:NitT/TauT family transport system ATP-binding protein
MNGAASQPRIVFDRVSVSFNTASGTLNVVDNVSYTIANGEFVSIIGPSGCGKTTMMNIVAGFVQPSSGSVTLDGKPIVAPGSERGVIFQDYGVFPWLTVEQNIAFGLKLRANRASHDERGAICRRYMQLMGLTDFANAYPKTLSGGMRQRLAIARATR